MRLLLGLIIGLLLGGLLAVLLASQISGARRDDLEIFGRDDRAPTPSGAAP
jgi:hypothetical protein